MTTVEERSFLVDMARKHLPGQHDQRDHGRRGSGILRALAAAATVEELAAAASGEAKRITGRDIPFDFTGSHLEVGRQHAEGILRGLERFPKARLTSVGTYGPGSKPNDAVGDLNRTQSKSFAATNSYITKEDGQWTTFGNIYFNNVYASNPSRYEAVLEVSMGTVASTPQGVAVHEFGHVLADHQAGTERAVLDLASERADAEGLIPRAYINRNVSSYATTNQAELAAEAFADAVLHGDKASDLSKAAFGILEAAYRGES